MSTDEDTGPLKKRQRLDKPRAEREGERTPLLSCLERIPLEILAEILSYVNSPKDVLSVARCSKHLCTTLVNPSNVMIWRHARRHCVVPDLPPPMPGWSEPAYAAFIFDPGSCYVSCTRLITQTQ
jgi:F-box-like